MRNKKNDNKRLHVVGASVERVDAIDKVTGRARYGADYNLPGQLYGAAKYAEYPHAEIISIKIDEAKAIPGISAVLTHHDIPGKKTIGVVVDHQQPLSVDRVRYIGDVVAIVAAESPEIAQKALESIKVDYKELETVDDPVEALRSDSPRLHENGNLCAHHKLRKGDVERGFSDSELIFEREYETQKIEHAYLEPEAIVAAPGENGGVTIIGSVQNLYTIRRAVAGVLDLPLNRVRIEQATLGGSFGGKDQVMSVICCRAALLALATGRPVKMVNSRENSFRESYKRHPYKMKYKVGINKDGLLQAMEIEIYADAGAYAAMSEFVTWRSVVQATGPYIVPNVKTDVYAAYTNNCYTSAMRGFGSPQICFATESLMDELAEELGFDPLELRLKNILKDGSITPTGQKLGHKVSVGEALLNVTTKADYKNKWNNNRRDSGGSVARGIGISCSYRGVSLGAEGTDAAGVIVSLQTDGTVIVSTGLVDMGQGSATTISMIVAEKLGVTIDRVRFLNADTSSTPDSGPTVASRTSFMAGNAASIGCEKLLARLRPVAAELLQCELSEIEFCDNRIISKNSKGKSGEALDYSELASVCFQQGISLYEHGWYRSPSTSWNEENGQGDAYFTFVYAANLAEVEVDTVTGNIRVVKFISSHDLGRTLNLNGAKGQVYGGVAMGLGYAVLEEYVENESRPALENFDEYLLPTICDIPEMDVIFIENPDALGPFGAKSLGEPACELAAPAIVNAVCNATGRRIRSIPLTLERVLLGKNLTRQKGRGSVLARCKLP